MRKVPLATGEYYHVFNRGVDKRQIVMDQPDSERFLESLRYFNTLNPIGSIYEYSFNKKNRNADVQLGNRIPKLVEIVAYCANPNHYHLILKQVASRGISKFMQRLGIGYTNYFNERHKRSGALFQGKFKAVHIETNEQLLHVSAYVNLNDRVHPKFSGRTSQLVCSSWGEYRGRIPEGFCGKEIILEQFRSRPDYVRFAESTIKGIARRRRAIEDDDTKLAGVFEP
ncbi:transposase [Candidatus Wolfebacteria bacterium]|nr:transposase [Candidatus Wolfebacteria bacterium]